MKKIIMCILLFSIIAFSGCLEEEISEEDFEINVEWNDDYNYPHTEKGNNHFVHDTFSLDIKVLNDKINYPIYYRVYEKTKITYGENSELSRFDDGAFNTDIDINSLWKHDKCSYHVYLDSIEENVNIKVILSKNEYIKENSQSSRFNDIILSKELPNRKIDISIEETPIRFLLSKKSLQTDSRQILIKNIGDVKMKIGVKLPEVENFRVWSQPQPHYVIRHGFSQEEGTYLDNIVLNPGESELFDFSIFIDDGALCGTHNSNLIIYSLFEEHSSKNEDAYYKKTFALETTVTE